MNKNFENISAETIVQFLNCNGITLPSDQNPEWFLNGRFDEVAYVDYFLGKNPMKCTSGKLFDQNGLVNKEELANHIYQEVKPYIRNNIRKQIEKTIAAMETQCFVSELPPQEDRIHLHNGTYFIGGTFTSEKEICRNRLLANYNPGAPNPDVWFQFLDDLLYKEDISTLQEFIGYCLLPTNRAQKMLIVIGEGGEGKSRIGRVLRMILGDNMFTSGIDTLANDRFAVSDLDNMLVMLDDDMQTGALTKTDRIKTIITMEDKMSSEKKYNSREQKLIYARLIAFSNGSLSALYDKTEGFYRRQIVLNVKPKPAGRKDDKYLGDKLQKEVEGILLWALAGLERLINNNYEFTISDHTKEAMAEFKESENNIIGFINSTGYIERSANSHATFKQLHGAYLKYCDDNLFIPNSERSFASTFKTLAVKEGFEYSRNISIGSNKKARGYKGIHVLVRTDY